MQFKRLTNSELESLQSDFIKFLALNGIDADSWQSIKRGNPERTEELIENFSDVVYSTTLDKIKYLMKIENDLFFLFVMEEVQGILYVFKIVDDIKRVEDINNKSVVILSSDTKLFSDSRQSEIFNLIESGCSICTDHVYNSFEKFIK
jgi:cag pathogenicity island protein 24